MEWIHRRVEHPQLVKTANTLAICGSLAGTGTFIQSAGTLTVSGDVSISNLALSAETFSYAGAGSQILKATTYSTFQKTGAGIAALAGNVMAAATTNLSRKTRLRSQ